MKNSKKGFTLTEILIVTAIIVIVSGAAIAGIAVTVANAQERGQNFQAQQGENWESAAVLKVKNTKIDLGNEQIYEESADTPAPTAGVTSDKENLDGGDDPDPDPNPDSDPDPDPDPIIVEDPPAGGSLKVGDYTNDNTYLVLAENGSTYNLQKATNTGDTVEFSLKDNGDGTYKLTITGGNKYILDQNSGNLFSNNGVYFWSGDTFVLNETCTSYFRDTLGVTPN